MVHFLASEPATARHKKGPAHCWRAFEVRFGSAHDTSHGPPCAVVVVVVVEAIRYVLMDWKVATPLRIGKRHCERGVAQGCPSPGRTLVCATSY